MKPPPEFFPLFRKRFPANRGVCLATYGERGIWSHQPNALSAFVKQSEFAVRMSRSTAYAIGAVLQLANAPPGQPVPCSRLAKTGEMPERFLLQILRTLVNHGLLKSTRGVDGGYSLLRPLSEITLLQIFEATEGPLTPALPPLDSLPETSQARLQEVLKGISAASCQSLAAVTLSDLAAAKTSGESAEVPRVE